MHYIWPVETRFKEVALVDEDRQCLACGGPNHICDHRHHRFFSFSEPVHMISKLCRCADAACRCSHSTVSPQAEMGLTMPRWLIGWDVFAWIGHRRFARHWSVPQIRDELIDTHHIVLSEDSIERYVDRYQTMVAARHQDPAQIAKAYRGLTDLILSIDGLQPEKGHETLYVVRELRARRVWFAEPLLSSAAEEVHRLIRQAKQWADRLGLPVRMWISDKQDAFVSGVAEVFPGTPHRYCENHFMRDLAKPILEADSQAKVAMRRKVRGLRSIERGILASGSGEADAAGKAGLTVGKEVVLDYCAAVRGVLNDDQGGPLRPPGLKMADSLGEIHSSLQRNLDAKKGAKRKKRCVDWPRVSTVGSRKSGRNKSR